jgi:hypothetical protein
MSKLQLLSAGTAALLSVVAMLAPPAAGTMSIAPASVQSAVDEASLLQQARLACTHRRVCRQGAGCAWRKVCKRW